MRVYNLESMSLIKSVQAHSAEILTMNYSPKLCEDHEGIWGLDIRDAVVGGAADISNSSSVDQIHSYDRDRNRGDGDKKRSLVMLATAGRDRLIHIFDASDNYSLITTLDYHSSSVTVVKFSPDGQRFISCGGDHTMVFSSVNGKEFSKLRTVQTSHGTINGLSIEATNKFVVTSGQDKRLNVWNLHTGKHMRAYRCNEIGGELYKTDIDPSGMFIAACSFDKTISLVDFFSGDLISQVGGHSELITGVKFSPDGRSLVSISGDGCILVWRISSPLVKAMQDRLMELYTTAQKRQNKAAKAIAVRQSRQASLSGASGDAPCIDDAPTPPHKVAERVSTEKISSFMPPMPPPPTPPQSNDISGRANPSPSNADARKSLSPRRLQEAREKSGRNPCCDDLGPDKVVSDENNDRSSGSGRHGGKESKASGADISPSEKKANRWMARAEDEGGYELFGRKVVPGGNENLNHFTLEVGLESKETTKVIPIGISTGVPTSTPADEPGRSGHKVDDATMDRVLGLDDDNDLGNTAASKLASSMEDKDDVLTGADTLDSDDDSDFDEQLFKPYSKDTDAASDAEADKLQKVTSHVDSLEQSASNLESWLEQMVRPRVYV
jgi:WD40 repeat protein